MCEMEGVEMRKISAHISDHDLYRDIYIGYSFEQHDRMTFALREGKCALSIC